MNENGAIPDDIGGLIAAQSLPRWEELPDLDLYMDQVLGLIHRYLGGYPGFDDKGLTSSMVNNYVKLGVMPPPIKRKYARTHLAHLIMICTLKNALPIAAVQRLIASELETLPEAEAYDRFCARFEKVNAAVSKAVQGETEDATPLSRLTCAALRARAEQALALRLYGALFPSEEKAGKQ